MNRKEWRDKLANAQTQEEFSTLFNQVPEATGTKIRTEAREFFIMEQMTIFPHLTSIAKAGKT
ncbi:MAG: hypothetical protein J0H48_09110 [Nitrosospira multiformis]|nr:hypothetical protein [Nitrosospira multiformis]